MRIKAIAVILLPAGCGVSGSEESGLPPGAVTFHFNMRGDVSGIQDFRVATNDPSFAAYEVAPI